MNDTPETNPDFNVNVVRFRPRDRTAFRRRGGDAPADDIHELLDLSRYELRDRWPNDRHSTGEPEARQDDYNRRMRANIAALIFLVALIGLAAADFIRLEQAQLAYPAEKAPVRSDRS